MENSRRLLGRYVLLIFLICVFNLACVVNGVKITLYDSSRIKDDLNWYKLSFKENVNMNEGQEAAASSNAWLSEKLTSRQDMYGWKESSFSLSNGDDIWRIHFVCDLNVQNIQNWLFTPLINTHSANRVTLNLTFTIRECEQFPIKQIVKNCREKFELYYEEITVKKSTLDANAQLNEEDYFMNEGDGADEGEPQDQAANRSSLYFLNKIKQLRFRDTFVSSTGDMAGLRYYNSVVDRQKHYRNSAARAAGSSSSSSSSSNSGDSMINVELREIPLSGPVNSDTNSFIRFAIRDTGACISLLGVQVSFTSCPAFTKYGIGFAETPTGRDLTDLIQVTGKCPAFSTVNQPPKAICTAKGEWLITDGNLSNRCLCIPGYQFIHDKCSPCMAGYYKAITSNENKCELCPLNSWSTEGGSSRCECVNNYYREDDSDYLSPCKAIPKLDSSHLDLTHINEDHVNMSINRASLGLSNSNIRLTIECFTCSANEYSTSRREQCDQACSTVSSANGWMVMTNKHTVRNVKVKLIIRQQLPGKELARTILYLNLNQEVKQLDTNVHVRCELNENERKSRCLNVSINLQHELTSLFGSEQQLANKLKSNADVRIDIYALVINNDYHLIPVGNDPSAVQPARHFVKLDPIESMDTLRAILFNNSVYSLLICNSPYELDKLKFEFTFREHIYSDVDSGEQLFDELARTNNLFTNKNFNLNKLDSYTIDVKLFQLCLMNSLNDKLIKKFFGFNYNSELNNQTLMSLKNSLSERSINPNGADSNLNGSNFKTHVLLPVLLSFCFVTFFILFAVFIRRTRLNAKSSDKDYDCEKHMRKFMPALNKSCSTKCINCTNPNTSSSNSSTTSSSASSSSRMSSTSPSTTCTTSQILERTSKLYYVDPHTYEDPALAIQEFAQEISPLDIKIESVIGGGEFGDVCKGKLKNVHNQWITVAIKTLKVGSSEKNRCDFLTEASIMAQFHHENIICLEGVVTQSNPYMIITEYMDNGSLDTFLRLNSWRLNIYDLIKMLRDIASGMKYLSEMNFVHRDLAARNILVNKELKCKVADFGLSREIEGTTTEGVYWTKGGKIPVRWTAPEAITHTKFTCSSDVWSYGVVAWEVMSYGERPYWNWSNTDVIKAVEKGFRLLIPPNCPQIIYNLMLDCWETDRLKRPRFRQIVNELDTILKSKRECLYATVKNSKQISYIDTNRPNFTQLTNIHEWLNSLNLSELIERFVSKRYLNLSQVLQLELNDLMGTFDIYDEDKQALMMESIKRIQFELNFQNGFLV